MDDTVTQDSIAVDPQELPEPETSDFPPVVLDLGATEVDA